MGAHPDELGVPAVLLQERSIHHAGVSGAALRSEGKVDSLARVARGVRAHKDLRDGVRRRALLRDDAAGDLDHGGRHHDRLVLDRRVRDRAPRRRLFVVRRPHGGRIYRPRADIHHPRGHALRDGLRALPPRQLRCAGGWTRGELDCGRLGRAEADDQIYGQRRGIRPLALAHAQGVPVARRGGGVRHDRRVVLVHRPVHHPAHALGEGHDERAARRDLGRFPQARAGVPLPRARHARLRPPPQPRERGVGRLRDSAQGERSAERRHSVPHARAVSPAGRLPRTRGGGNDRRLDELARVAIQLRLHALHG